LALPRPTWLRKWLLVAVVALALIPQGLAEARPPAAPARPQKVITVFWREGCTHCRKELKFLGALQRTTPGLEVRALNVADPQAQALFSQLTAAYGLPKVTPITVIRRRFLVGFEAAETTGAEIRHLLQTEAAGLSLEELLREAERAAARPQGPACPLTGPCAQPSPPEQQPYYLWLPVLGRVDLTDLTLPMLSLVLGLVDGFNPCAMWVLVAFLAALAQVGSLKRMIQLAGLFILAQGTMYLLILNSWFLAFDWIRADRIVTPLVGLVATFGGAFFLWEFAKAEGVCRVTGLDQRARIVSRLRELSRRSLTPMAVLGVLGIAFSVNVVEFACSIGIPQAYTKILDLNQVGLGRRELLMAIYIACYMLDDLVIFGLAIVSIEKIGVSGRYSRASNLIGGLIMLVLGALLLLAPERLRF
jgi:cytochrome c biogenesis protein CcdA/thiol-disulfide isomerase/thioredoxin